MRRINIFIMAALMALALIGTRAAAGTASATGPVVGSYSRVVNAAYLRMRTGPGYGYAVRMNMNKGEVVSILAGPYNGSWYKVSYRGVVGYANSYWLQHSGLAGASIARSYYKVVVVSLARQQVEAYEGGRPVLVTAATTGQPDLATPTGTYGVLAKLSPYKFVSPWPKGSKYYYESAWANYAVRYRSDGYYIHDAPWRPYYGYGTNVGHYDPDGAWRTGSHGCVNVPLWAESQLFNWIRVGTVVKVVSW